jgi:hypothetical protein
MSDIKEKVEIKLSVLTEQVAKGMKKKELATFYGISVLQMTKLLQQTGLQIRRFRLPTFNLVDDVNATKIEEKAPESLEKAEESPILENTAETSETTAPAPTDLGGLLGMEG